MATRGHIKAMTTSQSWHNRVGEIRKYSGEQQQKKALHLTVPVSLNGSLNIEKGLAEVH